MDPVTAIGLVASIGQLASLAVQVFTNLHKYYRDFEQAPKRSRQLRRELDRTFVLVTEVQSTFEANPCELLRPSLESEVEEFKEVLQEMLNRASPQNIKGLRRLKWPFREAENDEFIARIERFKSSFSLVMNIADAYKFFSNGAQSWLTVY
jgi:hypothetical protein